MDKQAEINYLSADIEWNIELIRLAEQNNNKKLGDTYRAKVAKKLKQYKKLAGKDFSLALWIKHPVIR